MSAVSIHKVSKQFKGGTTALENIDLEIEQGEFVSLIGPSGCGKSTLLRIIGDLIEPSSGELTVNGKSARQARRDHDYQVAAFRKPTCLLPSTPGMRLILLALPVILTVLTLVACGGKGGGY
jgi:ABC-type Fe3+/spermidine/putrescine transport system ATPase subunit